MPDPALDYASRALGLVAAFLAPVVLLLFVALRLRRRIAYPHGLLAGGGKAAPAAILFRRLRPFLDAAFDAAAAVAVGLAIAGPFPPPAGIAGGAGKGVAAALDCSASALFGSRGDRALDQAARMLMSDPSLAEADLYALSWDPATGAYVADDMTAALRAASDPLALADAIETSRAFMAADLGMAGRLAARGYARVVLLTDRPGVVGSGIEARKLDGAVPRYLYPSPSARRGRDGAVEIAFAAAGGAAPEGVWRIDADGRLVRAKPEHFTIRAERSGFSLRISDPGLWAVEWDRRFTPFEAPAAPPPATADGPLAERIAKAFGSTVPGFGSADAGRGAAVGTGTGRALELRDGDRRGASNVLYVSEAEDDRNVVPPALTLGRPVAAGASRGLAIGPAGWATPEAALPIVLTARSASTKAYSNPPPPRAAGRGSLRRTRSPKPGDPVRVGEGYVYLDGARAGPAAILPPVSEYAPGADRLAVKASPRPERRWLVAAILAILLLAKGLVFRARK